MSAKVRFDLEQNEDGFPPISVELLNARLVRDNVFQIQNAPFFAEDISYNDEVIASPTTVPGQYKFEAVVHESDFSSISIILLDASADEFLMDVLRGKDCVIEYGEFGPYRVLAVAIPTETAFKEVAAQLQSLEDRGSISYAELSRIRGRDE